MAALEVSGIPGVQELAGRRLGPGEWFEVTQDRVDRFAEATLDEQWIHVDPERARRDSPFGGTVAHGYLTLSLFTHLYFQLLEVRDVSMVINYGLNKVRFPAPVPVGARVRLAVDVEAVEPVKGGVQCTLDASLEVEESERPALAAQILFRYYE